jgi:hypothetical protein
MLAAVTWMGSPLVSNPSLLRPPVDKYVVFTSPSADASPDLRFSRNNFAVVVMAPSRKRGEPVRTSSPVAGA